MEAPDKIYISTLNDGDNHYYINKTDNPANKKYEVEYIRTDTLEAEIEKRIKVLQNHPKENHKTICHLDSLKQSLKTHKGE